jgi:hypothetical protein
MSESACAENADIDNSLVRLPAFSHTIFDELQLRLCIPNEAPLAKCRCP